MKSSLVLKNASVFEVVSKNQATFANISRCLALVSVALCSVWVGSNESALFGISSWKSIFYTWTTVSWHAMLMICGFFFSLIFAVTSWSLDIFPKSFHVFFQCMAALSVVLSLLTMLSVKYPAAEPHLGSLHSWIGALTMCSFTMNLLAAATREVAVLYRPETDKYSYFFFQFHRALGTTTIAMSVLAVLTGIYNELRDKSNYYVVDTRGYIPGVEFLTIPLGSRVVIALSVSILLTGLLTILLLSLDSTTMASSSTLATGSIKAQTDVTETAPVGSSNKQESSIGNGVKEINAKPFHSDSSKKRM